MDRIVGQTSPVQPVRPAQLDVQRAAIRTDPATEAAISTQVVNGEVVAINDDGAAQVRTAIGNFTLQVSLPLKPQDLIELEIQFSTIIPSARLLTVNSTPPELDVRPGTVVLLGSVSLPEALSSKIGASSNLNVYGEEKLHSHTIIDKVDPGWPIANKGEVIAMRVQRAASEAALKQWNTLAAQKSLPVIIDHNNIERQGAAERMPLITNATQLEFTVIDIAPKATAADGENPPAPDALIKATPLPDGITDEGIDFQTPFGTLHAKVSIPPHTTLILKLDKITLSDPAQISQAVHDTPPLATMGQLQHGWDSWHKLFSNLFASNKAQWNNIESGLAINATSKMAEELLHYLSLVRKDELGAHLRSNLSSLAGEYADQNTLEANTMLQEVETMLSQFKAEASSKHSDTETNYGWKLLLLPFYNHSHLTQANLYWREDIPEEQELKQKKSTRFIVEAFSFKLGSLQLDGLVAEYVRSQVGKAPMNFVLILRSQNALALNIQNEISAIFNKVLSVTQIEGTMTFEHSYPFPVDPAGEYAVSPLNHVI